MKALHAEDKVTATNVHTAAPLLVAPFVGTLAGAAAVVCRAGENPVPTFPPVAKSGPHAGVLPNEEVEKGAAADTGWLAPKPPAAMAPNT